MRVLHVITGLGVGGAETQLRLLVRHLPAECEVVTLTNPGPVAEGIRADGVPVTHLGMSGNRDLSALPRLARLIRSRRPDVVHTHLYRACVYGRPAARLAGVRTVVATEHSLGVTQIEGHSLGAATRILYRTTERLGSGTLAVSETVAHRLAAWGVPAERVVVAPNGIDPAAFRFSRRARAQTRARLGIPQDAYVVGGVGRQVRGKNFADLVRAVAADKDVHLLLAGDGPERVPLLRIVHQLGAAHRVHFTGPERDPSPYAPTVPQLLAAMDLFVSPSAEESFGLAVVEALACGLPVLYVNCPALEDLPPQDAPGARHVALYELAAAIRREHLAGPRRLPVPAAVEQYHIARTVQAVMALYVAATSDPAVAEAAAAGAQAAPDPSAVPHVPAPAGGSAPAGGVRAAAGDAPGAPQGAEASAPAPDGPRTAEAVPGVPGPADGHDAPVTPGMPDLPDLPDLDSADNADGANSPASAVSAVSADNAPFASCAAEGAGSAAQSPAGTNAGAHAEK